MIVLNQEIEDRKAKHRASCKKHYLKHLESERERSRQKQQKRYAANPSESIAATKRWQAKNGDKVKQARKSYYAANRDRLRAQNCDWQKANRHKRRQYANERNRSPEARLANSQRSRLVAMLKSKKSRSTVTYLGCSASHLRAYLESQFQPGWSWGNWGTAWEIDHIYPISKADLLDPSQAAAVFHWKNLRPLALLQNRRKGARVTDEAAAILAMLFNAPGAPPSAE